MSKKVLIISTSLRANSNSDALAREFARGAKEAGNEVEVLSLQGKNIAFCRGCLTCGTTGVCAIKDDAIEIEKKILNVDVVVWAPPIYYYEMSGQMKTLIDRLNPIYSKNYQFRDVYLLTTAAEDATFVPERAIAGLDGWQACLPKTNFKGSLFCGGVNKPGEIADSPKLKAAYELGASV
ncbi:MAG: flavodoxin family protein [Thermoguttaceae bacterium]|jgi:hypothetical protein